MMVRLVKSGILLVRLCSKCYFLVISGDDCLLQRSTELSVDGMGNISVGFVGIFATGHYDKVFVARIDDFDVMDSQLMVEGDRNYGFHGAVIEELSDLNTS